VGNEGQGVLVGAANFDRLRELTEEKVEMFLKSIGIAAKMLPDDIVPYFSANIERLDLRGEEAKRRLGGIFSSGRCKGRIDPPLIGMENCRFLMLNSPFSTNFYRLSVPLDRV
jgi:hypothetical protein